MKRKIAILGALAASMAMSAGVPIAKDTVPANQQQSQQQDKQTPPKQVSASKQRIAINPYGGLDFAPWGTGMSPKDYGQFLQSRGRQKWNK